MNRATSLSLFLCSMLTLVGCVDDNVSVFVRGNVAPTKEEGECTYNPGSLYRLSGVYDVSAGGAYTAVLDVVNQLRSRATNERAETNGVFITSARIALYGSDGSLINPVDLGDRPNPFSLTTSQFYIAPSPSPDSLSASALPVTLIPFDYGLALRQFYLNEVVTIGVELRGRTNGDIDIEVGEWTWDTTVCDGCLAAECLPFGDDFVGACRRGVDEPFYPSNLCE